MGQCDGHEPWYSAWCDFRSSPNPALCILYPIGQFLLTWNICVRSDGLIANSWCNPPSTIEPAEELIVGINCKVPQIFLGRASGKRQYLFLWMVARTLALDRLNNPFQLANDQDGVNYLCRLPPAVSHIFFGLLWWNKSSGRLRGSFISLLSVNKQSHRGVRPLLSKVVMIGQDRSTAMAMISRLNMREGLITGHPFQHRIARSACLQWQSPRWTNSRTRYWNHNILFQCLSSIMKGLNSPSIHITVMYLLLWRTNFQSLVKLFALQSHIQFKDSKLACSIRCHRLKLHKCVPHRLHRGD